MPIPFEISITLSGILLAMAIGLSVAIFRKIRGSSIFQTLLGYVLVSVWMFLSILNDRVSFWLVNSTPQGISFLTALLVLAAMLVTNSIRRGFKGVHPLRRVILYGGWFFLGMFFVQVIVPVNVIIIETQNGVPVQLLPEVLFLLFSWAIFVLAYLLKTDLKDIGRNMSTINPRILHVGQLLGFFGMVLIILQPLVLQIAPSLALSYFFLEGNRLMVQLAIILFFYILWDDPSQALEIGRLIRELYESEKIGLALFGFEETGPVLWFSKGFCSSKEQEIASLYSLGVSVMVILGQDNEYVEGSVLIPLASGQDVALAVGGWVRDDQQGDPRMGGRSFVVGLIILPKLLSWIFDDRERIEVAFRQLLVSVRDRAELTPSLFFETMRSELLEIAISS